MKRTFFLTGSTAMALTLLAQPHRVLARAPVAGRPSVRRRARAVAAGRCADRRRRLRWSGYTADDFPPLG